MPDSSRTTQNTERIGARTWGGRLAAPVLIALLVLLLHGPSVRSGLYLDDHAHYEQLCRGDWSFRSAVDASRLRIAGGVIDLWGRQEPPLVFFRPVAFWIMRAEYTLVGWSPAGMHVFSLLWHLLCCLLVGTLTMRCLGNRLWATAAAAIMAIHPVHVVTAQWIACQTELMATAFILLAILFYWRHARWPIPLLPADGHVTPRLDGGEVSNSRKEAKQNKLATLAGAAAVLCYALALGCRESVLLFPLVCWAGDVLTSRPLRAQPKAREGLVANRSYLCLAGRVGSRWLSGRHFVLLGMLVLYLALRWWALGGVPLPEKPYFVSPIDPDFPVYAINKLGMYLLSLFLFIPLLPTDGQMVLTDANPVLYAGAGAIVGLLLLLWRAWRWRPTILWPVLWIACFLAPVMPVFPSSYHLYLPSVGAILLIVAGLGVLGERLPFADRPPGAFRRWGFRLVAGGLAVAILTLSGLVVFIYRGVTRVEDILVEEVVRFSPSLRDGDRLFFINMPPAAAYAAPALRSRLGLRDLTCHVLTLSPDPLGMMRPGQIEMLDDRSFVVHAPPDERYLAGVDRVMLKGPAAFTRNVEASESVDTGCFRVTCQSRDENGVRALRFDFHQPVLSEESRRFHFYFCSPQFMAYPIR